MEHPQWVFKSLPNADGNGSQQQARKKRPAAPAQIAAWQAELHAVKEEPRQRTAPQTIMAARHRKRTPSSIFTKKACFCW